MIPQLTVLSLLCLLAGGAAAADVNIALTGRLLAASCDITPGSAEQPVHIGDFSASTFTAVGSVTAFKAFNINLTGCSQGITGARVAFTGDSDADDPALLALSDTSGSGGMAAGVGVELLDNSLTPLAVNTAPVQVYPLAEGSNTLSFLLRYRATRVPVTPGNASAVMYFDLTYQ